MLLVPLSGEGKDAPDAGLLARLSKGVRLGPGDGGGGRHHLLLVVHDALGRVLWEDDQVHARQALLCTLHDLADLAHVGHHLCTRRTRQGISSGDGAISPALSRSSHHLLMRVEARHLVLEDASPDRVRAGRDVSVARHERCEAISDKKSPAPQMYPASQVLLARSTVENGERETS